eukprot:CAMPEP_0171504348 /NCGR_PEP_ID=MMETSP0958-20121227/11513_1 /TAXON_ID=87120 /ORGANISM="Aurantiochytrium limacinum, Strain ATCCMYA-1381" /LENGTH=73 /DNA_ID=CAMNT_0012040163 /DNA_START=1197 /DNA_END=1419 /DNA_ORIENTATION=+
MSSKESAGFLGNPEDIEDAIASSGAPSFMVFFTSRKSVYPSPKPMDERMPNSAKAPFQEERRLLQLKGKVAGK